jgi:hypothetical protein
MQGIEPATAYLVVMRSYQIIIIIIIIIIIANGLINIVPISKLFDSKCGLFPMIKIDIVNISLPIHS